MSGLGGAAKSAVSFMTNPHKIEKPTSQKELKNVRFHFDLSDVTKTVPDTRPGAAKGATRKANVFKWQAASEAERKSIKDWIRAHGSHAEAAELIVPEDASYEEFSKILNDAAGKI
ncbi:hypothetical protein MMC29_001750 [Sticta canariensis]|nr:hypothetical protein [Sticta canariensis]